MTDKQIIIDGKECRYWFRLNPDDYRKCSLRGKNDNCDEIKDCFVKELLGKLALKEQECEELKKTLIEIKDMLKEICIEECNFDWNKTSKKHCGDCDCRYGQILQKISECEVENERYNNIRRT